MAISADSSVLVSTGQSVLMDTIQRVRVLFEVAFLTNGVELELRVSDRLNCKLGMRDFGHSLVTIDTIKGFLSMHSLAELAAIDEQGKLFSAWEGFDHGFVRVTAQADIVRNLLG